MSIGRTVVLIVRAEGHGALAAQPRGEFFVGAHEAVALHREQNGAQAIRRFRRHDQASRQFRD